MDIITEIISPFERQRIQQQISLYKQKLKGSSARLVAVSKTKPLEAVLAAYETGQRDFGENYVQELVSKWKDGPTDIRWHFIGHLQSNKVKFIAPFIYMIHGVDSFRLLAEIDKQAAKAGRQIQVLLQLFIAQEETKFGLDEAEAVDVLSAAKAGRFPNVIIAGLMGMASNTDDSRVVKAEFDRMARLKNKWSTEYACPTVQLTELSMGMTNDLDQALAAGSTMVRIGTAIFGARNYGPQ